MKSTIPTDVKVRQVFRIEGGILNGTEIEPILAFISVKYPHRKTKDLYIPPFEADGKKGKTWHCCQECETPEFEGGMKELMAHLLLHKGRLLKPWKPRHQLQAPIPAVRLPRNPWDDLPKGGVNDDRRFCIDVYIRDVERLLRRQGLEIIGDI